MKIGSKIVLGVGLTILNDVAVIVTSSLYDKTISPKIDEVVLNRKISKVLTKRIKEDSRTYSETSK